MPKNTVTDRMRALPLGINAVVGRGARVTYEFQLYEHIVAPEYYLFLTVIHSNRIVSEVSWRVLDTGEVMPTRGLASGEVVKRYVNVRPTARSAMRDTLLSALTAMVTEIRNNHRNCWPPIIKLKAIHPTDTPEPLHDIPNQYVGSAREKADLGKLTDSPTASTIAARARTPGNQGGWKDRKAKSGWTTQQRAILRFCNKLIKGVTE